MLLVWQIYQCWYGQSHRYQQCQLFKACQYPCSGWHQYFHGQYLILLGITLGIFFSSLWYLVCSWYLLSFSSGYHKNTCSYSSVSLVLTSFLVVTSQTQSLLFQRSSCSVLAPLISPLYAWVPFLRTNSTDWITMIFLPLNLCLLTFCLCERFEVEIAPWCSIFWVPQSVRLSTEPHHFVLLSLGMILQGSPLLWYLNTCSRSWSLLGNFWRIIICFSIDFRSCVASWTAYSKVC